MTADLVRNGRYQIVPPGGEKPTPHTRVTNFAKKLEDSYALNAWGKRMVLIGAAQRSDIIASTLAAGDDKRVLDGLAESAMDAAKANVRRELGTALHALCEQMDAGLAIDMPSPYREDIESYQACMASIGATVLRMEEVVVIPDLNLAGRFDRIVEINGRPYVADIKTGRSLDYSWPSIAIQLALYAQAETIYDPDTKTHEPMPEVDQMRGLVLHLPAGEASASAHWVSLSEGRRGIQLTQAVLGWRRAAMAVGAPPAADEVREWVTTRVTTIVGAGHGGDLAQRWPVGVPTLKASDTHSHAELEAIAQVCQVVEGLHRMPFPEAKDPRATSAKQPSKQRSRA